MKIEFLCFSDQDYQTGLDALYHYSQAYRNQVITVMHGGKIKIGAEKLEPVTDAALNHRQIRVTTEPYGDCDTIEHASELAITMAARLHSEAVINHNDIAYTVRDTDARRAAAENKVTAFADKIRLAAIGPSNHIYREVRF